MPPEISRSSRAGVTLLEMVIGASLLTVLLGGLSAVTLSAERVEAQTSAILELESRARRTVDRIAEELRTARRDGLWPQPSAPLGSSGLQYQRNEGWSAGAISWSPPLSIALRPSPEDPDYGADGDGDGLVDAGRVIWTRDIGLPGETSATLVNGVSDLTEGETANGLDDNGNGLIDERGLSFELDGDMLHIRLTLERIEIGGQRILRTIDTAIGLSN